MESFKELYMHIIRYIYASVMSKDRLTELINRCMSITYEYKINSCMQLLLRLQHLDGLHNLLSGFS